MEGSKNAMYAQAGRSRGWSQGVQNNAPARTAFSLQPEPASYTIPEPPVVVLPTQTFEAPSAGLPERHSAEVSAVIMSASVEAEISAVPVPVSMQPTEHAHYSAGCETPVMAYIPVQKWSDLYDPEQGISRGTMFAKLDLPFVGEGACRHE